MTEILEEASRVEMAERDAIIRDRTARAKVDAEHAAAREAARAGKPAICVGCEEPIPEPRRHAVLGCLRCAACERAKHARLTR